MTFRIVFYLSLYLINVCFSTSWWSIFFTFPSFVIILIGISLNNENAFGVMDMLWLTMFLFLVLAPLQSIEIISNGDIGYFKRGPADAVLFSFKELLTSALITFITLLSFLFTVLHLKKNKSTYRRGVYVNQLNRYKLFFIFLLATAGYILMAGGISNILSSRFDKDASSVTQGAIVFYSTLVASSILIFSSYINKKVFSNIDLILIITIILIEIILCNPFNAPRFVLIGTWLPVFFILFKGVPDHKLIYIAAYFSIIILLPILSISSRFGLSGILLYPIDDVLSDAIRIPYADLFDTMTYLVRYTENNGFTLGKNTLGMILFFVPRTLWPDKPDVIGIKIGEELVYLANSGTENLSLFPGAEMYMDFWYFGPIIAGIVLAYFVYMLGLFNKHHSTDDFQRAIQLMFLSAIPILIRGPAAAVLPFFFFGFFYLTLVRKIIK